MKITPPITIVASNFIACVVIASPAPNEKVISAKEKARNLVSFIESNSIEQDDIGVCFAKKNEKGYIVFNKSGEVVLETTSAFPVGRKFFLTKYADKASCTFYKINAIGDPIDPGYSPPDDSQIAPALKLFNEGKFNESAKQCVPFVEQALRLPIRIYVNSLSHCNKNDAISAYFLYLKYLDGDLCEFYLSQLGASMSKKQLALFLKLNNKCIQGMKGQKLFDFINACDKLIESK